MNAHTRLSDVTEEVRSPFTGLTRAHWEATADRMLLAVRPYASPDHALIGLPGPASRSGQWSDGLEGFARTFLLAAFRIAGSGGNDPHSFASWYAEGLTACAARWPKLDEMNQAKVEAASIAIALHETRPWIWDRLDDRVREQLLDWFGAFAGSWVPDNNWVWFRAVVAAFSRSAGGTGHEEDVTWAIERTEAWYAGGGWYSDGGERNFDHYSGWAMQFYPLWYCRIAGAAAAPGLADRYRSRLREYLADLAHLVGADGAPLFQGRSLTYRFAALAPFWTGALFDATPLAPGLTRRIASGMLSYFMDAGCLRADGTLSIGWHGEFLPIRQPYSGPASPYWASKGFAGLLLPPADPVWQAAEEPLPVERGDFTRVIRAPGWVASGTSADGIVRVANHGTDHGSASEGAMADDPFYSRWAYATRTGPGLTAGALDSSVALIDRHGALSHRRPLTPVRVVEPGTGVSRHQAHWPDPDPPADGPWLTTASVLRGCWEVRIIRIEQQDGTGGGPWTLHVGGWLLPAGSPPAEQAGAGPAEQAGGGTATVRSADGLTSVITALHGPLVPGTRRTDGPDAFGSHAAVPYLRSSRPAVPGETYAAAIALTADPAGPGEPPRLVTDAAGHLLVSWPDGESSACGL